MNINNILFRIGVLAIVVSGALLVVLTTGVVSVDGDSVPAFEEWKGDSDPLDADTDNDGLTDGRERRVNTFPFSPDSDDDALTDPREVNGPTDPRNHDTDDDGLADGEELQRGTDPTSNDTDSDGYWDGAEVNEGLDPLTTDSDGDGIDDSAEIHGEYETDPAKADTDGDGLTDGNERNESTLPVFADTDNDHLDDGAELNTYGTNATNADTDGDGLPDGAEVKKTDMLPNADPLQKDLFLELDYMREYSLPEDELETITERFASAPVSNPDGSRGITLHVVRDDQVPYTPVLSEERKQQYREKFWDWKSKGYLQVILIDKTNTATYETEPTQGAGGGVPILVTGKASPQRISFVFMHELGHTLGLMPEDYRGIDTRKIPYSDYPSVMNYNSPQNNLEYSDGTNSEADFNDWQHIADGLHVTYGVEYDWETTNESDSG